jgi:hypothetical protein
MACLWSDSFDPYGSVVDAQLRYQSATLAALVSDTAFTHGQAVAMGDPVSLRATFESNEAEVYGSLRLKYPSSAGDGTIIALTLQDATNDQMTIVWRDDGTVEAHSGGVTDPLLGSASGVTLNAWDSWQFKAVINASTGSVELRKNGGSVPILSISNANTQGSSGNSYCNQFTIGGSEWYLDDLYLNSASGAAPTTWPGDVRLYYMPVANAASQGMLNNKPSVLVTPMAPAATITTPPDVARYLPFVPPFSGTIDNVTISVQTNSLGRITAAIYGDPPENPLAVSSEMTDPLTGPLTFHFDNPAMVSRGQQLYLAIDQDFDISYTGTGSGTGWISSTIYGEFPEAAPTLIEDEAMYGNVVIMTTNNGEFVSDPISDGDATTVYAGIAGQQDIYTVAGMGAINPAAILGVRVMVAWRKSDAGEREGTVGVDANGSGDVAQIVDAPAITYSYASSYMPTDPVGSNWTLATVNGMRISLTVSA